MARIVWTGNARRDLARLSDFLAEKNPAAAARAVRTIRAGLATLKKTPGAGTPIQWLPDGYRKWVIRFGKSGYVVLYRVWEGQVVIQAIRHGREDRKFSR